MLSTFAWVLLGLSGLVTVRPAHAQWQVTDTVKNDNTGQTATNTKNTYDQLKQSMTIGGKESPGDRIADPQKYPLTQSSTVAQDKQYCSQLAQSQQTNCNEIVDTEDAQSQYMKLMYETTAKRNERLQKIMDERSGIKATELGKLEDNTNKLVALYTLMAIDRQQMESVNFAYETRIRYLRDQMTKSADSAATGGGSLDIGSVLTGLTTGAALKAALSSVQSSKPSGMRTLSVGD